ncbi:Pth4p [Sporobolomyces koalae]|uniref:Pth4p n=1 Tax=Sporobolomyces koalae TaxID=500713 RepID=UPI003180F5D6
MLLRTLSQRRVVPPRPWVAIRHVSTNAVSTTRPPRLDALSTQEDMQTARDWIEQFKKLPTSEWPKHTYETSFARSSGPGGQHVNRTLSKAILRFRLPSPTLLPAYVVTNLSQTCPYYSRTPPSILVSASTSRSQQDNLEECFDKVKSVILQASQAGLVGTTSSQQRERVRGLVNKEKAKLEKIKKQRKDVKSSRGKVRGWE